MYKRVRSDSSSSSKMKKSTGKKYDKNRPDKVFAKKVMSVVNQRADKKESPLVSYVNQKVGQFFATSSTTFSDGYHLTALNAPPGGTGDFARIANKIDLTGLQARFQFVQTDPTSNINAQCIRIMFFMVNGPTPGTLDITQFLQIDPMYSTLSTLSDRNPDYYRDFKVLCDKTFEMPLKTTSSQLVVKDIKINLKLNHDQHFYGAGSTNYASNQMYMLILTDSGNTATAFNYLGTTPYFPIKTISSGLTWNGTTSQFYTDV